jgi:hypothetical protein
MPVKPPAAIAKSSTAGSQKRRKWPRRFAAGGSVARTRFDGTGVLEFLADMKGDPRCRTALQMALAGACRKTIRSNVRRD